MLQGIQQQLPPSRRKTARKSASAEVCAESDRKQGEERTFDGVGAKRNRWKDVKEGVRWREAETDGGKVGKVFVGKYLREIKIRNKRRADEDKWTDGDVHSLR